MAPQENKLGRNLVEFRVTLLRETSPTNVAAFKRGISMVWGKHVGTPTTTNITFADRILRPQSNEDSGVVACYIGSSDTFLFGCDTLTEKYKRTIEKGLMTEEQLFLLLGSHEATHRVQIHRGDPPRYLDMMVQDGDPHEYEAWQETVHVYKKVYPTARLSFTVNGRDYELPPVSK